MAVYKDNNGSWYISVRYVNWKGEHARKVKRGFATKREARQSYLLRCSSEDSSSNIDIRAAVG